jgi:hypothetical protein
VQGSFHEEKHVAPELRWRVTTRNGMQFACRVHASDARVEVRLTTGEDGNDLLCSKVVPSLDAAGVIARRWLSAVVASDSVSDEPVAAPVIH